MELKFQRKKRDCDAGPSSSGYKSSKDVEVLTVEVQPTTEVEKENHKEQICLFFVCYLLFRRRQWHPTPVLLPGKSHGWRSLVGCSPWGC